MVSDSNPDRDIEREVTEVGERWSRFRRQPVWVRLLFTTALALTPILTAAAALLLIVGTLNESAIFALTATTVMVLGFAIWAAINPIGYLRTTSRWRMSHPTSAPGYATWRGDQTPEPRTATDTDEAP